MGFGDGIEDTGRGGKGAEGAAVVLQEGRDVLQ